MPRSVRKPIQVYLSSSEREALDQASRELGISRSEVLRRGLLALRERGTRAEKAEPGGGGVLTPATAGRGEPPPRRPVAPLRELLRELSEDRAER